MKARHLLWTRTSRVRLLRLEFLRCCLSQRECEIFIRSDLRSENRQGRSRHIPDRRSGDISRNQVRLPRARGGKVWGACVLNYFARLVSWTHAIQLIVGAPWIKTHRFANKHASACLLNCANPQLSPKRRRRVDELRQCLEQLLGLADML